MSEVIVTDQNFKKEVLEAEIPVFVDFWAPWCGPCQMIGPVISEIAKELEGKVKVCKLNVDENSKIAGEYGIMSIPTMKLFKNGKIVEELVGMQPKEIISEKIIKAIGK